ncbi:MAG: alkaline shock response membrane anchor protein AmaP [Candidatus Omnitrophica bacterium]|nr:alkaline shock response membrane anchor protein AmaP [Candidatus Omnitrophota bacterium]
MGFLTLIIYVLISFIVSLFFMGISLKLIEINMIIPYFENHIISAQLISDVYIRWFLFLIGFLVILFCLRHLQATFLRSRRERSISFESPHGKVCITLFAIEDMLKKMLDSRKEIAHIKPKVYSKKKGIDVIIRSNLASEVNLLEFTNELQESVQEKLHHLLGDEREIKVRIEIRKMFMGEKRSTEEESEPEIPFRNYSE